MGLALWAARVIGLNDMARPGTSARMHPYAAARPPWKSYGDTCQRTVGLARTKRCRGALRAPLDASRAPKSNDDGALVVHDDRYCAATFAELQHPFEVRCTLLDVDVLERDPLARVVVA